jgi:hypothetical protein
MTPQNQSTLSVSSARARRPHDESFDQRHAVAVAGRVGRIVRRTVRECAADVTAKRAMARRLSIAEAHVRLALSPPVSARLAERRRFYRVLFSGAMRWRSRGRMGMAEVLDLSEAGAAFAVPPRDAAIFGGHLSLQIELGPRMSWQVTRGARVVEIVPHDSKAFRVCVEFPAEQLDEINCTERHLR